MGETIGLLPDESRQAQVWRLDAPCDRFKAAWAAGQRPWIEEELAGTPASERPALLRRLLALELEMRHDRGEHPTPQEYQERFPGYVAPVEEVLAEVAIPYGWGAPGEGSTSAPPAHTPPPEKSQYGTLSVHDFAGSASAKRVSPAPGRMPKGQAGSPEDLRIRPEEAEEPPPSGGGDIASKVPPSAPSNGPTTSPWPVMADYEILGQLGSGGMGVVYRARQRSLNRLVALKMIHTGIQDHQELLARFRIEAEA